MGTPTARNVAPAGSEYAETVRSNHCSNILNRSSRDLGLIDDVIPPTASDCLEIFCTLFGIICVVAIVEPLLLLPTFIISLAFIFLRRFYLPTARDVKRYEGIINGDRYRAMITNFFIPELNNHDVQELWFQQDGATCHTARATIDLWKYTLGDRLISRFGPVNWPPRSCDLTPLDYFLWGYVKSLVYADKPQTLDYLEDNILRVIADIRPQMLEKVIENWTSRLDYIRASRASPMPEIIFRM
ncbi:putative transposable element [Trichonephila clavipes]|nr:putative transposable element [Trichonephila clavipes]